MKKVKKFGRGGDILTGLGAGLAGYGIYKALNKDKDDDYTRRVKEFGTKGRFPEEKTEEKATPKREEYVPADKEELDAKKAALSEGMQYKKPEGPAAVKKNIVPPTVIKKTEPPKTTTPTISFTKPGSGHAKEIKDKFAKFDPDPNKGKYKGNRADAIRGALPGKKPYTDSSGVVYNERGEPYAKADKKPANKKPADKKPADKKKPGDVTFLTKKRSDAAKESVSRARREQFSGKKVEGPKRTRYAKKPVTDKKYASGGSVSSASKRADGIAIRGKTRA